VANRRHPPDDRPPPHAALATPPATSRWLIHQGGDGVRLAMLVLHDDAKREYAYGPAQGFADTKVALSHRLSMTRQEEGWTVINMKNDWKRYSLRG